MKLGLIVAVLTLFGCKEKSSENKVIQEKVVFSQDLADELKKMAEIDQIAAWVPEGKYKEWPQEKWNSFKDSVFTTHEKRLKQIFEKYGFVGIDLAGKDGSHNFWLMVQHCDHNTEFQKEVLEKMKIQVDKQNADPSNFGLLVDRVNLNTGEKQIYGTQVTYNMENGQAYPLPLKDSLKVNERRKSIGLEPIEDYLNGMTQMHFEMNKKYYSEKGIIEPVLYKTQ